MMDNYFVYIYKAKWIQLLFESYNRDKCLTEFRILLIKNVYGFNYNNTKTGENDNIC